MAPTMKCKSEGKLQYFIAEVLLHEGEGVVARKPSSQYLHGLSDELLKFKVCPPLLSSLSLPLVFKRARIGE
jgi:ATP-dependent DNA ligase